MVKFDYIKASNKLQIRCDSAILTKIRNRFSMENKNAYFMRKYNPNIPTRTYAISATGTSDIGMYWLILDYLEILKLNHDCTPELLSILDSRICDSVVSKLKHELREYQLESVTNAMNSGRGICVLGTGGGKTLITAAIIENFKRNNPKFKCVVIVPDLGLVNQTYADFTDYGVSFKYTRWTGKIKPDLTADVIISNSGLITKRLDSHAWIENVDLLICDEVHKCTAGSKLSKLVSKVRTQHKFGLTGTLPDNQFDAWYILGKFGPIIYSKTSASLREDKYLSPADIKIIKVGYKDKVEKTSDNAYVCELNFIYSSAFRNKVLGQLCTKLKNNTLLLINHIRHGETLVQEFSRIPGLDKEIHFIQGAIEVDERDRVKQLMEAKDNIICIAMSSIFSTGVNIRNLHNIIFGAGGKAFIRTVQSIGRGLRLHESKNKLTIIDIHDDLKYGNRHADARKAIYDNEKIAYSTREIYE